VDSSVADYKEYERAVLDKDDGEFDVDHDQIVREAHLGAFDSSGMRVHLCC
jgi:hypothetical protein